eukprot:TRINITY_DN3409_c2_g1_i1.p1 TRINITY_DN3409_c2_g1~~TRINITY_DN3409_c2_g1_i1.p1  ORF type:complete len:883 (-),score=232.33 TRINITY_DN3409_c2_g1_i1:59-2377(-)
MELLRTYCMGDRPVQFQMLSDQSINFHNKFGKANYTDSNFKISIPVFSIHGNHDDPAGDGRLAALDLLSVCNLVNYFGKSDSIEDISVYPLLMAKGSTRVAIYGLGNIRDERLHRAYQQKKVKLVRPLEDVDKWFNIFVLHQNRAQHSAKNFIHTSMLDDFLDFVIWGHEHECIIKAATVAEGDFHITQPGSSVATSLSDGEAKKKHIGLLEIRGERFRLKPYPLNTVRPFLMEDVTLNQQELDPSEPDLVLQFLVDKVEEMLVRVPTEFPKVSPKMPSLPLIRLRVDYTGGFTTCNPQRFGQRFVGRVANPNDILLFHKPRAAVARAKAKGDTEEDLLLRACRPEPLDDTRIEDLIASFLGPQHKLELLPEHELNYALHNFVEKDEKNAITEFVKKKLADTQKVLVAGDPQKTLELDYIQSVVNERTAISRAQADSQSIDGDVKVKEEKKKPLGPPTKRPRIATSDDEADEQHHRPAVKKEKHHSSDDDAEQQDEEQETKEEEEAEEEEEDDSRKPKPRGRPRRTAAAAAPDPKPKPKAKAKAKAKAAAAPTARTTRSRAGSAAAAKDKAPDTRYQLQLTTVPSASAAPKPASTKAAVQRGDLNGNGNHDGDNDNDDDDMIVSSYATPAPAVSALKRKRGAPDDTATATATTTTTTTATPKAVTTTTAAAKRATAPQLAATPVKQERPDTQDIYIPDDGDDVVPPASGADSAAKPKRRIGALTDLLQRPAKRPAVTVSPGGSPPKDSQPAAKPASGAPAKKVSSAWGARRT